MKRFLLSTFVLFILACVTQSVNAASKQEQRYDYIVREMKFNKETLTKVKPILMAFIAELHKNKKRHDSVKDKYEEGEKAGQLTESEVDELMKSKLRKDEQECQIRIVYYERLKKVIGAAKAREVLSLAGDKLKNKNK